MLAKLTGQEVPFEWGQGQIDAFEHLQRTRTDAPIIIFPNFDQPFVIEMDASDNAVGTCLIQRKGIIHPTAYFSKQMHKA